MHAHSRRDEPQFFQIQALDWVRTDDLPLAHGLDVRVLNRDGTKGSATLMARLPPSFRRRHDAVAGTLEVFVLEGAVALEGDRVGVGGFLSIPEGSGTVELASDEGAEALLYWTVAMPLPADAAPRVTRSWQEPWQVQTMTNMPHGAIARSLRLPDVGTGPVHGGPGGMLRMILLPPGYADAQEHKHNCWEGLVFLTGELLMPPRGIIGPGTYLGNPAEFWHAPMATQTGCVVLVQTDEPVTQPPRPYAGGQQLVNGYREARPWLEPARHVEWHELPDFEAAGAGVSWSDLPEPPG